MKGNKLTSNKADLQTPEIEQKIFAAFFAEVVTVGDVLLVFTWYRGDSRLGLLTSLFITTGGRPGLAGPMTSILTSSL